MPAYAGMEVELPVMPRAGHDVAIHFTTRETPAGVRAFIVHNYDPLGGSEVENTQPKIAVLDERTPA